MDIKHVNKASYLNVYLTGQSNATGELRQGIATGLGIKGNAIQHRFPGEPIENWYNNGQIQNNLQYDLDQIAGTDTNIIVWFQGESNYDNYTNYEANFWGMYREFRKAIGSHMKFYIMAVHSPSMNVSGIRQIQRNIEKQNGRIWRIETSTYTRIDDWHMKASTYVSCGEMIGQKIKDVSPSN